MQEQPDFVQYLSEHFHQRTELVFFVRHHDTFDMQAQKERHHFDSLSDSLDFFEDSTSKENEQEENDAHTIETDKANEQSKQATILKYFGPASSTDVDPATSVPENDEKPKDQCWDHLSMTA